MPETAAHLFFYVADDRGIVDAQLGAFGVPQDQFVDRPADVQHAVGITEHVLIAAVPCDQPHVGIDHAHALADVLQRGRQHLTVEAQLLAGFVEQRHHFAQFHAGAAQRAGQREPRRCRADGRCQQAFGELHQRAVGQVFRLPAAALALRVVVERAARVALAENAFGQRQQFAAAHAAGPAARTQRRPLRVRIEIRGGEQLFLQARAQPRRHQEQAADVEQQRPEHAVGERVPAAEAEQLLRTQPRQRERPVRDPVCAGIAALGQRRQQQRVGPGQRAQQQTRERTGAARTAPVQAADQRGRELRHRGEREQAVLGEAVARRRRAAVIGIGHQRQRDDGDAAHPQHLAVDTAAFRQHAVAQQQRHHQIVADHRRERDAGDDDHAGGRGKAADVGHQRERLLVQRQRQRQHVGIGRRAAAGEQRLPRQGDRHHEHAEDDEIAAEQPARGADVGGILAFDHRDVELARQADDRGEGDQRLCDETGRQPRRGDHARGVDHARAEVAIARQVQQREHADGDERQQLHQRFQRHRQHHAAVVFGGVDLARAEEDGEHRQQQRDVQRGVGEQRIVAARRQHFDAHRNGFELQRDVGHGGDQRDRRDQRRQPGRAAVARGQEIGDRHDAVFAGNQHQPFENAPAEQQHQQRAEIDRQEPQAGARGGADRAVERPRRAVHRQRQRIDRRPRPAPARGRAAHIAEVGDGEQHAHIDQRHQQQHPTRNHARLGGTTIRRVYGDGARHRRAATKVAGAVAVTVRPRRCRRAPYAAGGCDPRQEIRRRSVFCSAAGHVRPKPRSPKSPVR